MDYLSFGSSLMNLRQPVFVSGKSVNYYYTLTLVHSCQVFLGILVSVTVGPISGLNRQFSDMGWWLILKLVAFTLIKHMYRANPTSSRNDVLSVRHHLSNVHTLSLSPYAFTPAPRTEFLQQVVPVAPGSRYVGDSSGEEKPRG